MLRDFDVAASAMLAGLCFFAGALLVQSRPPYYGRSQGLALFLFVVGLASVEDILTSIGVHLTAPHLLGLSWPFAMLKGPAIYAYVRAMTTPAPPAYSRRDLLLLGWPFLLGVILATPFYLLDGPSKIAFMTRGEAALFADRGLEATGVLGVIGLALLVAFAYLVAAFRLLRRHMKRAPELFSNIEDTSLSWARWVLLILSAAWLWGVAKSSGSVLGIAPVWQEAVASMLEIAWVGALAYFGVLQRPIFNTQRKSPPPPVQKYSRSALDRERMQRIAEKLTLAMTEEKLFEDSSLSLRDLSDRLGVSENYISQTLNDMLSRNFFDFVNAARVDEAKRLLRACEMSVLEVALTVGFNSRSTFNVAFKKHAGMTPSQFRAAAAATP